MKIQWDTGNLKATFLLLVAERRSLWPRYLLPKQGPAYSLHAKRRAKVNRR